MKNSVKIYVINCDRNQERMKGISDQLSLYGLKFERISAIISDTLDRNIWTDDACSRKVLGRELKDGEIACFLSHIQALKKISTMDNEYSIILEDDADIHSNFANSIDLLISEISNNNKIHPTVVHLASHDDRYSTKKSNNLYCSHRFPMRATGVLWTSEGARFVLDKFLKTILPYDLFLREIYLGHNTAFFVYPSIINELPVSSEIDDGIQNARRYYNTTTWCFFKKQYRIHREKIIATVSKIKHEFTIR